MSSETIMENGWELLYTLKRVVRRSEFLRRSRHVLDAAFQKILTEIEQRKLTWERTEKGLAGEREFCSVAEVTDAAGESHKAFIVFYVNKQRYGSLTIRIGRATGPERTYSCSRTLGLTPDPEGVILEKFLKEHFEESV